MSSTAAQVQTDANQLPEPVARRNIDEPTWRALCNSVFPGADVNSILMAVDYCKARKLDVLKKPVHIVPMNVKDAKTGNYSYRDVIMPGISEIRTTAARTGDYAGQDEPVFGEVKTILGVEAPEWCKVTVYKFVRDSRVAFTNTEYFEEAAATKKDGSINSMWKKRKRGQLAKCAEAGALRKAFPEEIGNDYTAEEMHGKTIDMGAADVVKTETTEPTVLDLYPEEKLTSNLGTYKELIASGKKTAGDIIKMIKSKFSLTPEQEKKITDLGK